MLNKQLSHTLTLSFTLSLYMLINFCFHGYAKMSLFMAENANDFFGPPYPVL